MRAFSFALLLMLAACAQQYAYVVGEPLSPTGPVVGARIEELRSLTPYEEAEPNPNNPDCVEALFGSMSLLVYEGAVVRVSTHSPDLATAEGVRVGDPASRVHMFYTAERQSAEYVPEPGHELFVWTDRENHVGLRFEIGEDERVTAIHAGTDLRNDEGCAGA
jgi:hypothetical protein